MEINKFKNVSVLVAGLGAIGKRHVDILKELKVGKLIVFDPNEQAVNQIIQKYPDVETVGSYEQGLLAKPFAVFILTPTKMHIPMAIQALEADAHVFIEKPLSNSSEGIDELKDSMKKSNKQVMVGFCMRYHSVLLRAKEILNRGEIGRLVSVRAMVGEDFPAIHPEYKEMYLSKYSGAFELVHDIDLAIWYADQNVKNVYGVYGAFSDYEFESPDTVELLMEFENKCVATVHLDFFQNPRRRMMELIGMDGVITVEFSSWDEATLSVYKKSEGKWDIQKFKTERNDMFRDENREFLELALQNKPMKCNIDEASKSLIAIEKVYKPY